MTAWSKYNMLVIGLIMIAASAFLLAEANSKQSKCESLAGKIVQIFNIEKQEGCAQVKIMQFFAYAGIAIGIALLVTQFVRRE